MKNLNWKQIVEVLMKILVPFVPKGWRTVVLNGILFVLGVIELIIQEGSGLLAMLCQYLHVGCDGDVVGLFLAVSAFLNIILRTITDTPVAESVKK